jgi:glucose dehydrogenase
MCADKTVDVVIVGSGIAGALVAKQLGLAGRKVLLLEAGAEPARDPNDYMNRFFNSPFKAPETLTLPISFPRRTATILAISTIRRQSTPDARLF